MRTLALLSAVVVMTGALRAEAAEPETVTFSTSGGRSSAVTGAPMKLASLGFGLEYERAVSERLSFFASVEGSLLWKGMGGQAGARVYTGDTKLQGLFVDAHAGAFRGRFGSEPYTQWGGGMLLGHSWIVGDGLLVSLGGGADVKQLDTGSSRAVPSCLASVCYAEMIGEELPASSAGTVRVTPALRAAIGYAF